MGLHVWHTANVILMDMGQHDLLQFASPFGFREPLFQQRIIDVKADARIEQDWSFAGADEIGVGAWTGKRAGVFPQHGGDAFTPDVEVGHLSARPWCR